MAKVIVVRPVSAQDPQSLLGAAVEPGVTFFVHEGPTFGCVNVKQGEIALSMHKGSQFFAFPADAVRYV